MTHDLTQEAWIARFREYFIEQVKLEPGTEATESILEGELETWIDDHPILGVVNEWKGCTPEQAVWENLSYWES